ncbi:MAG: nitroreductase family protein [Spirochaetaceae bacterium]|nr:nitroreductase family protein [Spirochaetaceae bacterium]
MVDLTPSSFGFEAWSFHVVVGKDKKESLYEACFKQESMNTSVFSICICIPKTSMSCEDPLVQQRGKRFPGSLNEFLDDYRGYYEYLKANASIENWLKAQTYLVCSNMMNAAVEKDVQSCAIEGFNNEKVLDVLGLDKDKNTVGIIITFGYRDEPIREKIRMAINEISTFYY